MLRRLGVQQQWMYVVLGCVLWFCLHEAGIHPTLAGVAMGLLAPTTPRIAPEFIDVDELADCEHRRGSQDHERHRPWLGIGRRVAPTLLHPWASYVIIPLFALANTGVDVEQ